tara:strand:+ start:3060 stop:4964 length:1905 start_codon:yes stop_codon:yes gene_type:complete
MDKKNLLEGKKVLLINPDDKKENDKTFCFWASEDDEIYREYKRVISTSWGNIRINNESAQSIFPLKYYHIDSIDLYNYSREIISKYEIKFLKGLVKSIREKGFLTVQLESQHYTTRYIFDSRPPELKQQKKGDFYISQSFYGFKIELQEYVFEENVYRMMDFRVSQSSATQFVYILPYNTKTALVELTRFGKSLLQIEEAEKILNQFIKENFGAYRIIEKEKGVIPMDSVLPKPTKKSNWINIGTRAGNVKPSTGYAFKNMYTQSKFICNSDSFKFNPPPRKKRFHFYDQLLLIILTLWPQKGKPIFEQLFKTKSPFFVLTFLDEKSNIFDEFKMFFKLQIGIFLKATLHWLQWKLKPYFIPFLMILATFLPSGNESESLLNIAYYQVLLMVIGMLIIGIPHGALDHFTEAIDKGKKITVKFISRYLMLMALVFLIWVWNPFIALIVFLVYSAWHFGQTDVNQWGVKSKLIGFLWGCILLGYLFITHFDELNIILSALEVPVLKSFQEMDILKGLIIGLGVLFSACFRKFQWFLVVCFLFFSQFTNLIFSFAIYFILHHSRLGWLHLKNELKVSHLRMYLRALPFNLGAVLLFVLFFTNFELSLKENIAYFFIFLSCVSFPHVLCMDSFYKKSG